jgi:hypothetical protein
MIDPRCKMGAWPAVLGLVSYIKWLLREVSRHLELYSFLMRSTCIKGQGQRDYIFLGKLNFGRVILKIALISRLMEANFTTKLDFFMFQNPLAQVCVDKNDPCQ